MKQQKFKTILGVALAFACVANAAWRKRRRQRKRDTAVRGSGPVGRGTGARGE